jgi:glyoxylase-like metal-dependent hydrolase (beta-lactamase superfamily II)
MLCLTSCRGDQAKTDLDTLKIADNVHLVIGGNGRGSNVGVYVGEDGILLVDAMVEESSEDLLKAISTISDKPITHVLNTHSDSDHSGGNAFFANLGATIISQENSRYSSAPTDSSFSDRKTLQFYDETIELYHVVSHSFDDAIIWLSKSNVVFMGDVFTTRWHPTFSSGGVEGQREALMLAVGLAGSEGTIVPGHGTISEPGALLTFSENTTMLVDRVEEMHDNGLGIDSIVQDEEFNRLLMEFNIDERPVFVTGDRRVRFVERIISTQFVRPIAGLDLQLYEGIYAIEDGRFIRLKATDGILYAYRNGVDMAVLIPRSATSFHIRASLGDHFTFSLGADGSAAALSRVTSEGTVRGTRVADADGMGERARSAK